MSIVLDREGFVLCTVPRVCIDRAIRRGEIAPTDNPAIFRLIAEHAIRRPKPKGSGRFG